MVTPADYVIAYGVLFFVLCMVALVCVAAVKAVYSGVKLFQRIYSEGESNGWH